LIVDGFSPFQRHAGMRNRCCKVFTRMSNSVKSTEQDHYKVLGVSPKANQKEIREAFIKGAKRFHPDVTQDQSSLEKFKEIAIAYEVLSDDRSKALYDTQRRYTGSAAPRQGMPTPGPPREEEKMTPTRQKALALFTFALLFGFYRSIIGMMFPPKRRRK